jgi:hypothetical protein
MDRRTIIKQISFLTGAAFVGSEMVLISGCKADIKYNISEIFSIEQIALLDEIGEIIIPETDTPGAKSINIGQFINKIVTECYTTEQQNIILTGIKTLQSDFEKKYNSTFIKSNKDQRSEYLNLVNNDMKEYKRVKKNDEPDHYFLMLKQLTILGYFTSEPGATKALNYVAVPGRYNGETSYKKGEKAWATS